MPLALRPTSRNMDEPAMPVPDDSGAESESNTIRRKFQRTTTDPEPTFRKPAMPASAMRGTLDRAPSLTNANGRRKSSLRENMRIPSGPRQYPSSPGKTQQAPPPPPATSTAAADRAFLPLSTPLTNSRQAASSHARQDSIGRRFTTATASTNSITPGPLSEHLNFLPDVNFDDFQTTLKNYDLDSSSPLLSDFPAVHGGRILPKESFDGDSRALKEQQQQQQQPRSEGVGGVTRTQSFKQRLTSGRQASGGQPSPKKDITTAPSSISSLRNRRQSSITQLPAAPVAPPASAAAARPPRKSVGPGLLTGMVRGASGQHQASDSALKPALARTSSLSKARRTTIQPSASAGAELPRMSTLTATTQSRQNKVKSLQPPPREPHDNQPNTPNGGKASRRDNMSSQTPTSSGGRRQSIVSGRASGLGARTISPTDARRLKRMSMAQAPPMPSFFSKAHTPTPQDELPNPLHSSEFKPPELPRFAQPSPSFIPRKANSATPSSTRASPERHVPNPGGLSSKSSFQSLSSAANGSTSRLPTPKLRGANQSSSALGQYTEQYGDDASGLLDEAVPPVPAIPKAYESPKDFEQSAIFSSSMKYSQSALSEMALDGLPLPNHRFQPTPRTSMDVPNEGPRKRSVEMSRPTYTHKRNNTLTNGSTSSAAIAPASTRAVPDANGRKNVNLQPLRLPPLNLNPINTRALHSATANSSQPRPSQELDSRDIDWSSFATPEPKRNNKTPSTPMTASKASFFSRSRGQDDVSHNKPLRSSSSHYALRDVTGMDDFGNVTKYWDDGSDGELATGVPIPKPRNAITPFTSGSLPKASGEFVRLRSRPSGEYGLNGGVGDDDHASGFENMAIQSSKSRTRAQTNATISSMKSALSVETTTLSNAGDYADSPASTESSKKDPEKKESAGSGLRRKLSMSWRRSNSKNANHADNKNSPRQDGSEDHGRARLQKRSGNGGSSGISASEMPPPKLPASAAWNGGDLSLFTSSARPSLEASNSAPQGFHARRKSQIPGSTSSVNLVDTTEQAPPLHQQPTIPILPPPNGIKTRSQHSEQPTPVASRSSSWSNIGQTIRTGNKSAVPSSSNLRQRLASNSNASLAANAKDKDDLAADDEMHRLSRKRKDVDSAARETEELKKRAIARSPVTADHILHDRALLGGSVLNVFERGEIVDYEQEGIYFTGTKSARKVVGSLSSCNSPVPSSLAALDNKNISTAGGSNNFGYDDERGDYNIVLGDHLSYRYEVVDVLGKGSFGQVVRCVDHKDGGIVAVKIIRNKKRFHQQALVEVGILGRLREWDPDGAHATLSITTSFYFRSHLCIVTPCLSINLYELIRAHHFAGFPVPLIRRFARQLLSCLCLLSTKRIIHCDLKPENILLCDARCADVRVIDFGSSCREEEKVYTYIQSRFYRSPEVILGATYGLPIDMWSLGCILAELWTGYPLFPGENEQEQLACIMEIFGPPDRALVERCSRRKLFFDSVGKPRVSVSSKGRRRRPSSKTLAQALKCEDDAFVDFIARCLRWDPERRLRPADAMTHPWITGTPLAKGAAISAVGASTASTARGRVPPNAASPAKRTTGAGGAVNATPATAARARGPAPETPVTAVRNGTTTTASAAASAASPSKVANRRISAVPAAASATAGTKKGSSVAVGGAGRTASGSLAQMAARESMGVGGGTAGGAGGSLVAAGRVGSGAGIGSGRWR